MSKKVFGMLATLILTCTFGANVFATKSKSSGFSIGNLIWVILGAVGLYIIYTMYVNRAVTSKSSEVSEALEDIAKDDASWDKESLRSHVQDIFYGVQSAIADRSLPALQSMLHPSLYKRWEDQILGASRDISRNVIVEAVSIVDVKNYKDDEKDTFTAAVEYTGEEYTVHRTGKLKFIDFEASEDTESILLKEYWTFERENNEWVVLDVHRQESWRKFIGAEIIDEE